MGKNKSTVIITAEEYKDYIKAELVVERIINAIKSKKLIDYELEDFVRKVYNIKEDDGVTDGEVYTR